MKKIFWMLLATIVALFALNGCYGLFGDDDDDNGSGDSKIFIALPDPEETDAGKTDADDDAAVSADDDVEPIDEVPEGEAVFVDINMDGAEKLEFFSTTAQSWFPALDTVYASKMTVELHPFEDFCFNARRDDDNKNGWLFGEPGQYRGTFKVYLLDGTEVETYTQDNGVAGFNVCARHAS
ncbi:MAG: hypothetical protein PHD51_04705 [Patescibacteria group bacterium]|nr:hypothetical protein [Patescibacteria group bacterium]MDD5043920.1 hypothetical protein [Patescibacteria group bacterium]MDD5490753.1 hypothetical protein [Patescibacteria group bacterium]